MAKPAPLPPSHLVGDSSALVGRDHVLVVELAAVQLTRHNTGQQAQRTRTVRR